MNADPHVEPDDELQERARPSVEGFYRLVRANRLLKMVTGALALGLTVMSILTLLSSMLLREYRLEESTRAQQRWESPAWRLAVRAEVDRALSDGGYASADEVSALRQDLHRTRDQLDQVNARLERLLGRIEGRLP